ncbi:MAG: putative Na+/H+ antiporter, partial [Bdellovibrionota bacterium]
GGMQGWWLEPILCKLTELPLYLGAIGLTAFTDNAALTYLGTLVPSLSDSSRYALVAGAVVGGGLTVIANAPNPAGYSILQRAFGDEGISPFQLFVGAIVPTLVAGLCFWFL